MSQESQSQEQRILQVMRKVLTQVIREITPEPGLRHPLSDRTIEDVRQCLALLSARERELNAENGQVEMRPRYADTPSTTSVVQFQTSPQVSKDAVSKDAGGKPAGGEDKH